jgi:hypothetical protein
MVSASAAHPTASRSSRRTSGWSGDQRRRRTESAYPPRHPRWMNSRRMSMSSGPAGARPHGGRSSGRSQVHAPGQPARTLPPPRPVLARGRPLLELELAACGPARLRRPPGDRGGGCHLWLCGRFTWHEVVRVPTSTGRRLAAVYQQACSDRLSPVPCVRSVVISRPGADSTTLRVQQTRRGSSVSGRVPLTAGGFFARPDDQEGPEGDDGGAGTAAAAGFWPERSPPERPGGHDHWPKEASGATLALAVATLP